MDKADGKTEGEELNLSFSRQEVLLLARYTAAVGRLRDLIEKGDGPGLLDEFARFDAARSPDR